MKLSEIPALLREIGVSPVKSLGQNFLHDRNLARWIVDQANLTADDYVIEIGPGLGALTQFVLATGARVLAIDKDKRLVQFLRKKFTDQNLEIVHGDALEFDTRILYAQPRVKFLGNLPYYISSQLLIKFLEYPSPISLWLLMLQKELAKRIGAAPGTKDYGALTLQIQLHERVEYLRSVSASVFLPKPDVDSALVRVTPRGQRELPACNSEVFERLVRRGFSQRRKQLGKLIREEASDWETIAAELRLNPRARAEELSLQQWIALANRIAPIVPATSNNAPKERLQVVDEKDVPRGGAPRDQVHANNLLHRAVHVLIFNSAGDVLLQLRSRWKDRHPLKWDSSAAGHVNAGEDYGHTAARELFEELGIKTALKKVAKLPASERTDQEFICLYHGAHDGDPQPNPAEIEAVQCFPSGIVDQWIKARPHNFAPGFVECWKVWREKNP
ncbi:MAG TPA: 16S rRNA (adenine(1518)-N(6)/adenine(1519)-N(6))-dimethyltransferase RsmA [Chthoniobacterales bacterium]|jgi:16S rRNA (adenine1518-N6/adenine1519-N6)-dimethyltransferase|nr:16S rRNA (adenine(1518)-N(6)/adenine(1519)-N(6))-dimethyltransferase RsmA [Chthoniobacterales bacterium]